ncbi:putative B3 domain-containing protein At5g58280 isoform X2 [Papaver somniferum]|uniref:putative B3 domain-containing protein At5g58280 isoform X2 n=1 Tax=Papaver somniferum TaxID=3469 RepID=UPI000E702258|nr:putative B3 domain-containing protein At5g58280 isoform X2 [Papaver somniferum]
MADVNPYEEARKQRLDENRRRFQDLGVDKIVKSLTPVAKPFIKDRPLRKKLRSGTSTRVRKAHEKVATAAQRANAIKRAEDFRVQHVPSSHPSYVKSMLQSHVYHGFWLNVPNDFCQKYLTEEKMTIVLEDEEGVEYDTIYIGEKTGLSGGWKAFAKDHKLDDGDALVFELIKPTRFKVHIFKGIIDGVGEANTKKPKKVNRSKPIKKVKNSDAEEEDTEEVAEQIAKPRERQTRNSKKAGDDL